MKQEQSKKNIDFNFIKNRVIAILLASGATSKFAINETGPEYTNFFILLSTVVVSATVLGLNALIHLTQKSINYADSNINLDTTPDKVK